MQSRTLVAMAVLACVAWIVAGCGGGDAGTETTGSAAATPTTEGSSGPGAAESKGKGGGGKERSGPSKEAAPSGSGEEGESSEEGTANFGNPGKGGDNSIQTFGSEAGDGEEEEVVAAMRDFFRALAAKRYSKVCMSLTKTNLEQFEKLTEAQKLQGGCPGLLEKLYREAPAEARQAAAGEVAGVRIGEGAAFVLFTPKGGDPSYFVMKEEDGTWKATGVSTGTPFPGAEEG